MLLLFLSLVFLFSFILRNYLCDLIETNHLFLKMLEGFTREKKILVRGKKRGREFIVLYIS